MGYELVHENKKDCGCKVERYEHDFWSTSSHESITRCTKHQKEYEEEQKLEEKRREERRRQEEERLEEIRRLEEERRRQKEEERNSLLTELKRISDETNDRVVLREIIPDLYSRNQLIKRRECGARPLLKLEKVRNRWMCNKEAAMFYMANIEKLGENIVKRAKKEKLIKSKWIFRSKDISWK